MRFTRRLENTEEHVKNFRVQCLCLTGQPSLRPNLVHFVSHITKHFGLMICGEVEVTDRLSAPTGHEGTWLKKHKIKAFHQIVQSKSFCLMSERKNPYDSRFTIQMKQIHFFL